MKERHDRFFSFLYFVNKYRLEKGFKQNDLAYHVGVEPAHMNKILNGRRRPGYDLIMHIADALEVKAGALMDDIAPQDELLHFKELLAKKQLRNMK